MRRGKGEIPTFCPPSCPMGRSVYRMMLYQDILAQEIGSMCFSPTFPSQHKIHWIRNTALSLKRPKGNNPKRGKGVTFPAHSYQLDPHLFGIYFLASGTSIPGATSRFIGEQRIERNGATAFFTRARFGQNRLGNILLSWKGKVILYDPTCNVNLGSSDTR